MKNKSSIPRIVSIVSYIAIFIISSSMIIRGTALNGHFAQLDPFYEETLFALKFDYNDNIPPEQSLQLHSNLITGLDYPVQTDPDPELDNNVTLINHDLHNIRSTFLALENIQRSEYIPLYGTVEWQASLPYFKYITIYNLPSGENVIQTQDLMGLTLKLDREPFENDEYLVGYANIPLDFLEFIFESINTVQIKQNSIDGLSSSIDIPKFSSIIPMDVEIKENKNELMITIEYSNITYLFQTDPIDSEQIVTFNLSDKFVLVEFESMRFSTRILKYSTSTNVGAEIQVEMKVGGIRNLLINEELPSSTIWSDSTETYIEKHYKELFSLEETISWYKGDDIEKRLLLFSDTSLSFLVSHNLGVLEGVESTENSYVKIDGYNTSREDLIQSDIMISDNVTITQNEDVLFINHIKGKDYALHQDPKSTSWELTPAKIRSLAINQHPSLSGNILFLEESSILNSLMVDGLKRFIANATLSSLSEEQLLKIATLYLPSAEYIQEFQIDSWLGYPTKIKSTTTTILDSNNLDIGVSKISNIPFLSSILSLSLMVLYQVRIRRKK